MRRRTSRARGGSDAPPATYDGLPQHDPMPVDQPADPGPVPLVDLLRERKLAAALTCRAHDRRREHVRGDLVERGREPQQLVR